jgi:hypothetical protein
MKYVSFPWLPVVGTVSSFKTVRINGTNIHILTNIEILSPKNEDYTEINDRIVNTFIADDSGVASVGHEGQSGEQPHPRVSEQSVTTRTTTISALVISFILPQSKTLDDDNF